MEDLIDAEFGRHDYDWLLTPPEPPSIPVTDASKHQQSSTTPTGRSRGRSVSTTRASRLSAPVSENSHSARSVRSSSVTRGSVSNASGHSNKTSVLNTSSASATSRPSPARSRTPVKTRPPPTSAGVKTSRPQIPSNSNPKVIPSLASRSNSRSSTPTRRPLAPTAGRDPPHGQIPKPTSRPSSPGPRAQASIRPVDQLDFPIVAPLNPRPKLPERPISAGSTHQGAAVTTRIYSDSDMAAGSLGLIRRSTLPVGCQGKFLETLPKAKLGNSGHDLRNKVATATESTGFGRTISKNSLDMALRHMDIRQGMGSIRAASLYPHSICSAPPKHRPVHVSDHLAPTTIDKVVTENGSHNGSKENDRCIGPNPTNCNTVAEANKSPKISRERNADLLGSYRYDAMLSAEDSKNTSWLHGVEDGSDPSELFDHRFEPLPEPFGFV